MFWTTMFIFTLQNWTNFYPNGLKSDCRPMEIGAKIRTRN